MEDFTDDKRSPLLQFSKKEELLMLAMYPAIFCKSDNGMYSVLFPDFNCATCGDNLEDAMEMAIECMAGHVYSMQRDKEELPVASEPSQDLLEKECKGVGADPSQAFWNDVCVDVSAYAKQHFTKSVKNPLHPSVDE